MLHSEILLPEGASDTFKDREYLWNCSEQTERRLDAQLCREILLSVPHVLFSEAPEAALRLVRGFALGLTDEGMIVDLSLHQPSGTNDARNVHVHLLTTLRRCDVTAPFGFGPKVRAWNDKAQLQKWRDDWQHRCNRALAQAGIAAQVSARSYASRGIDKIAEPKLGPWLSRKVSRAFRLIRTGAETAGQAALQQLARDYDVIANYLLAKLHNLRTDELVQLDRVIAGLQLPVSSQIVRERYSTRVHYTRGHTPLEAQRPSALDRDNTPSSDRGQGPEG